ncbi:hypothetical protein [Sinorhizobium americanum]|uniref:Uncharacterized protein n=1 Tax=Sinorhizobium americanum TaxID=194963 RepID=A0A4R2BS74_9HYPH|nr:hypothetical protein [Sinorhizobium americanum]TCN30356.1 hypothetical protein EV184_108230 [Sinorhizobium americanum]
MADTKISSLDATNREALRKKSLTPRGCLVGRSVDLTTINASSGYTVPFDAESYDTDGIHDNVTSNTRMTVPSGWSYARVGFNIFLTNVAVQEGCLVRVVHKNSAGVEQSRRGLPIQEGANADFTEWSTSGSSAPVAVSAGDYFELLLICNDTSISILASYTAFWMELLA